MPISLLESQFLSGDVELPDWAPSVQDVADLLLTRTRTGGGGLEETFNDKTTPTAGRVLRYIIRGVSTVISRVNTQAMPSEQLSGAANELATLYAGMRVELGFYSEQITTNRSPYLELKKLWEDGLVSFIEDFNQATVTDPTGLPLSDMGAWSFPPTEIGDGILP